MRVVRWLPAALLTVLTACGVPAGAASTAAGAKATLRLATTTSTADSGLLDAMLADFEQQHNAKVEVIAVGTGQALALGDRGDVDVVLVHARERENEFIASGHGINRRDVMYNDFVVVGPANDPAAVATAQRATDAFGKIVQAEANFVSRGDDSGTAAKEQAIWTSAGITTTADLGWYQSLGQGMGETLIVANEQGAYALSDRGTFLSMRDRLLNLRIIVGGDSIDQNTDPTLRNHYGVIQVNPDRHDSINAPLAAAFVEWITAPLTQERIGAFGREQYGQPLFYRSAAQQ